MAKNILRRQFSNMYGKNKPYQIQESIPNVSSPEETKLPQIEPLNVTFTTIILYVVLLALFIFIYLNRKEAYDILQKIYNDFKPRKDIDELEEKYHKLFKQYNDSSMNQYKKLDDFMDQENRRMDSLETRENKLLELLEKNTCNSLEKAEDKTKEMDKKEDAGGLKKLDDRLSMYTKEQLVTSNGFCYIGYDKNQRECTNVSDGDICMSGQVFPSMDVCQYPKFRH